MGKKMSRREFEHRLAQSILGETAERTPACYGDDDLLALLERGNSLPNASAIRSHVRRCGYCFPRMLKVRGERGRTAAPPPSPLPTPGFPELRASYPLEWDRLHLPVLCARAEMKTPLGNIVFVPGAWHSALCWAH